MRLMNSPAQTPAQTPPVKFAPEVVSATTLMRGQPVLHIEHAGERYQLRLTRNGKLILTK